MYINLINIIKLKKLYSKLNNTLNLKILKYKYKKLY